MLRDFGSYARTVHGLYNYVRTPPWNGWETVISEGLRNREARFLDLVRRAVFSRASHPYHQMFRVAGCSFADLEHAVRTEGLEPALGELYRQGVFLTHDELKGKVPIVRGGRHIPAALCSFMNPLVQGGIAAISGGSRSPGTWTRLNTPHCLHAEVYHRLVRLEFGLEGRLHLIAWGIMPSFSAISQGVRFARLGQTVEAWFSMEDSSRRTWIDRIATNACVAVARASGAAIPFPRKLPPNDFSPLARHLARGVAKGAAYSVGSTVSAAVRIAGAALDRGLDIRGTLFLGGGETLTAAKQSAVEAAGAEVYSRYVVTELGPVGFACRSMRGNCVHLFRDSLAVIEQRRRAPLSDAEVNSLLFTALTPYAPHVLINAEFDDCGTLERANCGCAFFRAGFTTQIRGISSFGKLTGQGVTLVGNDVLSLLEDFFPARFGGVPGDYQLVEHEGSSQTQLTLLVSPKIGEVREDVLRRCFFDELGKLNGGRLARRLWAHTCALEIVRAYPILTPAGKVLPLHLLGKGQSASHEP